MKNNNKPISEYFNNINIEFVEIVDPYENDKQLQTSLNKRIKQLRHINRYNAIMHLLIQNNFRFWNPSLSELKTCIYQFYQYMACGHYDKQTFAPFMLDNGNYDFEAVEQYRQNYLNKEL